MNFTGIKDVDLEILSKLDDGEIGKLCSTNKYFRNLCKEDVFWRNRTIKRFGKYLGNPEKLNDYRKQYNIPTWRLYYISIINFLDKLISNYDFDRIDRGDLVKLKTLFNENESNFEEQILNNYDEYKWKDILKEELFDPNNFGYIFELSEENRIEYLEYLLNSKDKRIDPNKAHEHLLHLYLSVDNDKSIIEKYLKDPRTSIEKIIDSVVQFAVNSPEDVEYSVLDLYLDFIKESGGVERLEHKIRRNINIDNDTLTYIFMII